MVQRLVVLPGGVDADAQRIYQADHALLSHIAWALGESGGPLTDFDRPADFASLAASTSPGVIHVVEHGAKGIVVAGGKRKDGRVLWHDTGTDRPIVRDDFTIGKSWYHDDQQKEVEATGVDYSKQEMSGADLARRLDASMPPGFAGRIRITACWSGVPAGASGSLADQVAAALSGRRPGIVVSGVTGPSVTSPAAGHGASTGQQGPAHDEPILEVIRPVSDAETGRIIDELRQRHNFDKEWYEWLDKNPKVDLETLAKESARRSLPFYRELVTLLRQAGHLQSADNREQMVPVRN